MRIREIPYFGIFHAVFLCYVTASFEEELQHLEKQTVYISTISTVTVSIIINISQFDWTFCKIAG